MRVPIGIPVETNAGQAADSIQALTDRIASGRDVIKDAAATMRMLRGSTETVKAAKDQLRATIDREKQAMSQATLGLLRQGKTFEKVTEQAKKQAKAQEELKKKNEEAFKRQHEDRARALGDALSRAGGPAASLRDRLKAIGDIATKGGGLGLLALAAAGLAAAAVALGAAIVASGTKLGTWIIRAADAARSMQFVREAALGSAKNADNLGTQVAALANKVPTSTQALNELAASLGRARLGGQVTVDLLNAVAQASSAIDDGAGAKIREIVERGRIMRRMFLGLQELQGTGLDFDDVAKALAESMKVGVNDARRALLEGRVKLEDGAKAMRLAVEKKFGDVNLRKMMTLDGLSETLRKKLGALASDVDLEPAARAVFDFLGVLDQSTATGAVLKRAVTVFGQGIVQAIKKGAPIAKEFVRGLIIGGLKIYIAYLKVRNGFKEAFGDTTILKNVDAMKVALGAGEAVARVFGGTLLVLGSAVAFVVAATSGFVKIVSKVGDAAKAGFGAVKTAVVGAFDEFNATYFSGLGKSIIDGILKGLDPARVVDGIKNLAERAKNAFADKLMIRSPSKVFERQGYALPQGTARGVEKGTPEVHRAVENMAPITARPRAGALAAAGGGGTGTTITVNATIVLQGGAGAPSATEQVQDPGLLAELTKTFKEAAAAAGLSMEADAA